MRAHMCARLLPTLITFAVSLSMLALVSQVSSTGLTLAEPLPGGAPAPGAKLQAVTGFVDREGGSFYQEWSALFVMQGSQGERIFFYYPRLQTMSGAEEDGAMRSMARTRTECRGFC